MNILFAIGILLLFILCSACVFGPSQNLTPDRNVTSSVNIGIREVVTPMGTLSVSLGDTGDKLHDDSFDSTHELFHNITLYYVIGKGLDEYGNSSRWLLGITRDEIPEMLVYNEGSWTTVPWNSPVMTREIRLDTIVLPETVFAQHRDILVKNPGTRQEGDSRDLELKDGTYRITIRAGTATNEYRFDAATGALILA
jgi:hypothetical protein